MMVRCPKCDTDWNTETRGIALLCPSCRYQVYKPKARRLYCIAHEIALPPELQRRPTRMFKCPHCNTEWESGAVCKAVRCSGCKTYIYANTALRTFLIAHNLPVPDNLQEHPKKVKTPMFTPSKAPLGEFSKARWTDFEKRSAVERYRRAQSIIEFCRSNRLTVEHLNDIIADVRKLIIKELIAEGYPEREAIILAEQRTSGHTPTFFTIEY